MSPEQAGLVGGIAGGALGLLGGVIGTYASIRNTHGPRERAFMVRCACGMWLALACMMLAAYLLPVGWRPLALAPVMGLGFVIPKVNRAQRRIFEEEAGARRTGDLSSS